MLVNIGESHQSASSPRRALDRSPGGHRRPEVQRPAELKSRETRDRIPAFCGMTTSVRSFWGRVRGAPRFAGLQKVLPRLLLRKFLNFAIAPNQSLARSRRGVAFRVFRVFS
jgi:hypothetical protein